MDRTWLILLRDMIEEQAAGMEKYTSSPYATRDLVHSHLHPWKLKMAHKTLDRQQAHEQQQKDGDSDALISRATT